MPPPWARPKRQIMSTQSYCAGTIKRKRRTADEMEQLDQQIIDVLRKDHPQSVRHVFYRMTDPRLPEPVEKSDRGYRHVQDRVKKLRRSGRVPANTLRKLLRWHIESYLPADALEVVTVAEQSERDHIRRMAELFSGGE